MGLRQIRAWLNGADVPMTPIQELSIAVAFGMDMTAFMAKNTPPSPPSAPAIGTADRQAPYAPPPIDEALERDVLRIAMSTAETVASKRPLTADQRADLVSNLLPILRDSLAPARRR